MVPHQKKENNKGDRPDSSSSNSIDKEVDSHFINNQENDVEYILCSAELSKAVHEQPNDKGYAEEDRPNPLFFSPELVIS